MKVKCIDNSKLFHYLKLDVEYELVSITEKEHIVMGIYEVYEVIDDSGIAHCYEQHKGRERFITIREEKLNRLLC